MNSSTLGRVATTVTATARDVAAGHIASLRLEAGMLTVESTVQDAAHRIEAGLSHVESAVAATMRDVAAGKAVSLRIEEGLVAVESTVDTAAHRIEAGILDLKTSSPRKSMVCSSYR